MGYARFKIGGRMPLLDNFWIGFGAGVVTAVTLLMWFLLRGSANPRGLDMPPYD
jgi:hypothetical protein